MKNKANIFKKYKNKIEKYEKFWVIILANVEF